MWQLFIETLLIACVDMTGFQKKYIIYNELIIILEKENNFVWNSKK